MNFLLDLRRFLITEFNREIPHFYLEIFKQRDKEILSSSVCQDRKNMLLRQNGCWDILRKKDSFYEATEVHDLRSEVTIYTSDGIKVLKFMDNTETLMVIETRTEIENISIIERYGDIGLEICVLTYEDLIKKIVEECHDKGSQRNIRFNIIKPPVIELCFADETFLNIVPSLVRNIEEKFINDIKTQVS